MGTAGRERSQVGRELVQFISHCRCCLFFDSSVQGQHLFTQWCNPGTPTATASAFRKQCSLPHGPCPWPTGVNWLELSFFNGSLTSNGPFNTIRGPGDASLGQLSTFYAVVLCFLCLCSRPSGVSVCVSLRDLDTYLSLQMAINSLAGARTAPLLAAGAGLLCVLMLGVL